MNTQVISIESDKEGKQFRVIVLIGTEKHQFTLTIQMLTVANHTIEGVRGDHKFLDVFRFNQNLAVDIYNLVLKVYQGQRVDLPIDLGTFWVEELGLVSQ